MMFMFKFYHGFLPDVFGGMFTTNNEIHEHFTRQSNKYHSMPFRLEIVRRSIRIQGIRLWNTLSNQVSFECLPDTFKYHMKKYLNNNFIEIIWRLGFFYRWCVVSRLRIFSSTICLYIIKNVIQFLFYFCIFFLVSFYCVIVIVVIIIIFIVHPGCLLLLIWCSCPQVWV